MKGDADEVDVALVVFALGVFGMALFLRREERERTVRARTLWVRPGVFALVTVLFAGAVAMFAPAAGAAGIALAVLGGAGAGGAVGALVVRWSTVTAAGERGAVRVRGNTRTVIAWVLAVASCFAARSAFDVGGTGVGAQLDLGGALLALGSGASLAVAFGFRRAMRRLAPAAGNMRPR